MAEKSEKKATDQQLERLEQMFAEGAKLQEKWIEQSQQTIDEMSKLMKSSLKYTADLTAELRRVSLESTRTAFETFSR
ncbi:MAG: hypothetical protein QM723_03005 [Myxococcaceae bacterium]